MLAEINMPIK